MNKKEETIETPCIVTVCLNLRDQRVEKMILGNKFNGEMKIDIVKDGKDKVIGHPTFAFVVDVPKTRAEIKEVLKGTVHKISSISANYEFPEDRKSDKEQADIYLNESEHFKALKLELEELNNIPLDCVRFKQLPMNCDHFELEYDFRPDGDRQILKVKINHVGDGEVQKYVGEDKPYIASKCKHLHNVLTSEYIISSGMHGISKNVVDQVAKILYRSFMRYRMFAISSSLEDTSIKVITIRDLVLGNYTEDTFKAK